MPMLVRLMCIAHMRRANVRRILDPDDTCHVINMPSQVQGSLFLTNNDNNKLMVCFFIIL